MSYEVDHSLIPQLHDYAQVTFTGTYDFDGTGKYIVHNGVSYNVPYDAELVKLPTPPPWWSTRAGTVIRFNGDPLDTWTCVEMEGEFLWMSPGSRPVEFQLLLDSNAPAEPDVLYYPEGGQSGSN